MTVSVAITQGDAALGRLEDAGFVEEWQRLDASCAWGTAFQSFAFVDVWYRLYHEQHEPVIVEGRDGQGRLVGLLTLARRRSGRLLVGAGDYLAEYQTWIATNDAVGSFVWESLRQLERTFPRGRLDLTFLPSGTPVAWVGDDAVWPRRIRLKTWPRMGGVIELSDQAHIEASLHKGHNRSRLNHLRRRGDVELETIDTVEGLSSVIDEIAVLGDLRQGAINGNLPFRNNPLLRPLLLEMMGRDLLRVTVLRVGSSIASAHLDVRNADETLMFLLAHSPSFARDSPGSLHLLLLARQLGAEGVARYDLSPGGAYKDRFATAYRQVHKLTVQFGLADRVVTDLSGRVQVAAIAALSTAGYTPRSALDQVQRIRDMATSPFTRSAATPSASGDRILLRLPHRPSVLTTERLALDRLEHLLGYDSSRSDGRSVSQFLQLALHRLDAGHRFLTRVDGSMLAECWWMSTLDRPSAGRTESSTASFVLLYDPVTPVLRDGSSSGRDILGRLAPSLREIAPGATVFIALPSSEAALLNSLVEAGATREAVAPGLAPPLDDVSETLAHGWPGTSAKRRVVGLVGAMLHDVLPQAGEAILLLPA